jgi:hypothetical protein
MDYNIKYLEYKNKYNNLKNLIGNGNKTPEEKAAIEALKQNEKALISEYKNRLVKAGFTHKIDILVKKIMEKEFDIDYVITLFGQLKKLDSPRFRTHVILDILIKHKSSNQKFKEKLDLLIQINNSDLNDFSDVNFHSELTLFDIYFNMPDLIFELLKDIIILNQRKHIDIYYLLTNLNSLVVYLK